MASTLEHLSLLHQRLARTDPGLSGEPKSERRGGSLPPLGDSQTGIPDIKLPLRLTGRRHEALAGCRIRGIFVALASVMLHHPHHGFRAFIKLVMCQRELGAFQA